VFVCYETGFFSKVYIILFYFWLAALETVNNKAIVNMDYYTSDYNEDLSAANTTFKYRTRNNEETITAKGPLSEAIRLKVMIYLR